MLLLRDGPVSQSVGKPMCSNIEHIEFAERGVSVAASKIVCATRPKQAVAVRFQFLLKGYTQGIQQRRVNMSDHGLLHYDWA